MEDWGLVEAEIKAESDVRLFTLDSLNYDVEVQSVHGDLTFVSN